MTEYAPTNAELMDPESQHFTPDWWQTCEILPPDPWAYIVSDFQWSLDFLVYAEARVKKIVSIPVGHYPETNSPTKRMEEAYSLAISLRKEIENMISSKQTSLEFAWKWGEYQKEIVILYGVLPKLESQKGIEQSRVQKADIKFLARQWYSLWYEDYKKTKQRKISREYFNPIYAKILTEIKRGKRISPAEYTDQVNQLIKATLSNKLTEDRKPKLTRNILVDFWKEKYQTALSNAIKNKDLPPFGIESYPLKS